MATKIFIQANGKTAKIKVYASLSSIIIQQGDLDSPSDYQDMIMIEASTVPDLFEFINSQIKHESEAPDGKG